MLSTMQFHYNTCILVLAYSLLHTNIHNLAIAIFMHGHIATCLSLTNFTVSTPTYEGLKDTKEVWHADLRALC